MKPSSQIDRKSYEPAYIQLVNILRDQIANGIYPPGSRLPSESQLCKHYQVSPMTVRRTINILVDQGVVKAIQGRGTFVQGMALGSGTFHLQELQNLFRDSEKTKVKLLELRILKADEDTARKLGIGPGERTILIRRLLLHEDIPIIYHQGHLIYDPQKPVVEAEMEVISLYGLFAGTGETNLKRGELTIEAITLDEKEAELLQIPKGFPAFCLEHLFYDFKDAPVSWGRFICRGDRLKFTTTVGMSTAL